MVSSLLLFSLFLCLSPLDALVRYVVISVHMNSVNQKLRGSPGLDGAVLGFWCSELAFPGEALRSAYL